jgi:hypothetical protein
MLLGDFEAVEPLTGLKEPHALALLRPWVDVGSVGTLTLSRVERYLHAQEIGRLARPGRFYDFTRYRPRSYINQGRRELFVPNTIIRYASREESPDLLFVHLLEPHLYGEDYVDSVLAVLEHFQVKRYSLIGGMYDMVPHTRPLLVSGAASGPTIDAEDRLLRVRSSNYEGPTTITYLISQQAAERGIQTRTFVVHLPQYFQVEEDFSGAARLMEILCTVYHLPSRLIEQDRGQQQYTNLQATVRDTTDMTALLQRLEEHYDQEQRNERESSPPLSPDIEQFLRELGEGFDR